MEAMFATVQDNLYPFCLSYLGTGKSTASYSVFGLVLKIPTTDVWLMQPPEDLAVDQNTYSLMIF